MYRIIIKKKAKKFIDRLPLNEKKRIVAAIELLPNGEDIKKLKGHNDLLRLRVGEYRIIYTVDHGELIVMVIDAGNRGEIYNRYQQNSSKKQRRYSLCFFLSIRQNFCLSIGLSADVSVDLSEDCPADTVISGMRESGQAPQLHLPIPLLLRRLFSAELPDRR